MAEQETGLPATQGPVEVEAVNCPACDAVEFRLEASGPDFDCHTCGDQRFNLCECLRCGAYYLNPRPVAAALPQIYSASNYYSYTFSERANPVVLRARLNRDKRKVAEVLKHCRREPGALKILDIGAGDGSLLRAFADSGVSSGNLFGLELDRAAVGKLDDRGFRGLHGRVETVELPQDAFDCIALIQVIEHIAAPAMVLEKLHRSMRKDALLLLETPNMAAWDRRYFRAETWGGYHFPRHWTLWDPRSISAMLAAKGFTIIAISTPPAAVLWAWSINHVVQRSFGDGRLARVFNMSNPVVLGLFWALELLPSLIGRSANMRILARRN